MRVASVWRRRTYILLPKGHKQLLGALKLSAAIGEEQTENVYKLLEEWGPQKCSH